MSASFFSTMTRESDPDEAFEAACNQAFWAQSPGGYTGTIADKESYVIVQATPLCAKDAAVRALELQDAPRVEDKWGPAGAIPVVGNTRTVKIDASLPTKRSIGLPASGRFSSRRTMLCGPRRSCGRAKGSSAPTACRYRTDTSSPPSPAPMPT